MAGLNLTPQAPQTIALRPLTGGMRTEINSAIAPEGSFAELKNVEVVPAGLKKFCGWTNLSRFDLSEVLDSSIGEEVQDFTTFIDGDGTSNSILVTNRFLYRFDPDTGFSRIPYRNSSGFVIIGGSDGDPYDTIRVAGDITSLFSPGDYVGFASGNLLEIQSLSYVSVYTTITLTNNVFNITASLGKTIFIFRAFSPDANGFVDWTAATPREGRSAFYLVDGAKPHIYKFDDGKIETFTLDDGTEDPDATPPVARVEVMLTARTILYYKERLYFGDVTETDGVVRSRVRWTEVLDWTHSLSSNYMDLDYSNGSIIRLIGADSLLLAFTQNAVFYGQQTNIVGLPYAFFQLQTGNVSAVGPKAVLGVFGACAFIGQDDVYLVQMTEAGPKLDRIGTPVAETMLTPGAAGFRSVVVADPVGSRLFVALRRSGTPTFDSVWIWNYKTKGWSIAPGVTELKTLNMAPFTDETVIDELTGFIDDLSGTISSFLGAQSGALVVGVQENFLKKLEVGVQGEGRAVLETQDFDFGIPDATKTFTMLGIRARMPLGSSVVFGVEASVDYGSKWKSVGSVSLENMDVEDSVNFRVTGSAVRFRLTETAGTGLWTLLELTMRVKMRSDREFQRSQ